MRSSISSITERFPLLSMVEKVCSGDENRYNLKSLKSSFHSLDRFPAKRWRISNSSNGKKSSFYENLVEMKDSNWSVEVKINIFSEHSTQKTVRDMFHHFSWHLNSSSSCLFYFRHRILVSIWLCKHVMTILSLEIDKYK